MVAGWLLDVCPSTEGMDVWIKTRQNCRRIVDTWQPSIYAAGSEGGLDQLRHLLDVNGAPVSTCFEEKVVNIFGHRKGLALRISFDGVAGFKHSVDSIQNLAKPLGLELFNIDVPLDQMYLYEKDLFPLASLTATPKGKTLQYTLHDSVEDTEYILPPLKMLKVEVERERNQSDLSWKVPIAQFRCVTPTETITIDGGEEPAKILQLAEFVKSHNPDVIVTKDGDDCLFPYLAHRAETHNILNQLCLGRDTSPLKILKGETKHYFSYGRIYRRSIPVRFQGRIHIDAGNSFTFQTGLEGTAEVARTCRIPLNRAARTTIGTSMMSLQLYQAYKSGILIPQRKSTSETFKTAHHLLVADRGGLYVEPKVGVHEDVVELDFSSMYPTIMENYNLSGETVNCPCCPNSQKHIPEVNYRICEKHQGIVPASLHLVLQKRLKYKTLKKHAKDEVWRNRYDQRAAALKWILVCAFGYLGYRNARFGRVEAHIATCAISRNILTKTCRLAEHEGFQVIHGIVDSLYLKKPNCPDEAYEEFTQKVQHLIGIHFAFEGRFRWIAFLPSKLQEKRGLLSKFYGVFTDGKVKARGIETRRGDTPPLIAKCQTDIINTLRQASNLQELRRLIPKAMEILDDYLRRLEEGDVAVEELVFRKRLSKNPCGYRHRVSHAIAAQKLERLGREVSPGEDVSYVVASTAQDGLAEAIPLDIVSEGTVYDAKYYQKLLTDSVNYILSPIRRAGGCSQEDGAWRQEELFNNHILPTPAVWGRSLAWSRRSRQKDASLG